MIMKYQKITNLLYNTTNEQSNFYNKKLDWNK